MRASSIDFLIVGQGLAGTLLAHYLLRGGAAVRLVDSGKDRSASEVAAGIVNPITGRRFVKSWRIDELLPFARAAYAELEQWLSTPLYRQRRLLRAIFTAEEENDWQARAAHPGYSPYIGGMIDSTLHGEALRPPRAYGEVLQAAQADIGELVRAARRHWHASGQLLLEPFDFHALRFSDHEARYGDIRPGAVVCCEGFQGKFNPYFEYLPFKGDKGEALLARIPGVRIDAIVKHKLFVVPQDEDLYWVGATYTARFVDTAPSADGVAELKKRLNAMLKRPFDVVRELAAVRPTVKDRRPLLGRHPRFRNLFIFNGLGAKGASLGPFFAAQMARHLLGQGELDPQVNIARWPVPSL
jgi:glycine oxidase